MLPRGSYGTPLPTLMTSLLLLLLPSVAQSAVQSASEPTTADEVIYYDFLEHEGGALRGGRVAVEPGNPLHTLTTQPLPEGLSPVTTLMDNGPVTNRIDLVFVGDGYQAAELPAYASDVDGILPVFFAKTPLDHYISFFNVHRVDVTSVDSGVDNDPVQGILKNTALDMAYWCGGTERLLCVNVGKAYNHANGAPDVDQVLGLANSSMYGGAGYPSSDLGTLAADNSSAIEIALHEFGHSMGNLADEYDYGGPTTYTGPEPSAANASIHEESVMTGLQTKWHLWFPVAGFGTFEGCNYSLFGIYRPSNNSLMRSLGRPFQGVNGEQMIFKIYEQVNPIDAATDPTQCDPGATYAVSLVQPTHGLDVQWKLDGVDIPGATAASLDASTLSLGPGSHVLSVHVVDATTLVRDEVKRAALMTESRSWTLSVAGVAAVNAGANPASLSVGGSQLGRPVFGETLDFHVDVSGTTGHAMSTVIGFFGGWNVPLGGGQVLLVDISHPGGEIFGFPLQAGNFAVTGLPVANDPSLCGSEISIQAIHMFGVQPFALSNAQVLTLGY